MKIENDLRKAQAHLGAILHTASNREDLIGQMVVGAIVHKRSGTTFLLVNNNKSRINYLTDYYEDNYHLIGNCNGPLSEINLSRSDCTWSLLGCPKRRQVRQQE